MNKQYFQVNVKKATPACGCDCPNLQIDIDDEILNTYPFENKQSLIKSRIIRCVNDTYCQRLYEGLKESESKE